MPSDTNKLLRDQIEKNKHLLKQLRSLQTKEVGVLGRSSIEAYAGITIAVLLALLPMTWWLRIVMFIVLSLVWCDFAWRSPATYTLPPRVRVVFAAAVIIAVGCFAVPNVTTQYHQEQFPPGVFYATSWGALGESVGVVRPKNGGPAYVVGEKASKMVVNGALMTRFSKHYRIMILCFHYSGAEDATDLENLSKSKPFDITDGLITIVIPWSSGFEEEFINGASGSNYAVLLVPSDKPTTFGTIRDATKSGAVVLQTVSGPP